MTVRAVPEADWEAAAGLSREAYGTYDSTWFLSTMPHCPAVGTYDGERLVAFARVKPYAQWFGGRAVPMGGVASVAVAASHQRRGLARATVAGTLPLMRERGYAISALFPTIAALYRGLGWEHAGDYTWLDVPAALLRALGPVEGVTLRRGTADDLPAVFGVYQAHCRDTNGLLDRSGPLFDQQPEVHTVAERPDGIEGFSRYERRSRGHDTEVEAWDVVATTPAALRALWFALGAGSSTVRVVRAKAFADDVLPLLAEAGVGVHEHLRWMLRLVDAPAAVAARGWPSSLRARVDLDVADDLVPDNAGRWRLTVEEGSATLERGGDGTVALGIGALSSLYSGYADPRSLRRAGLLSCASDAALGVLATMTAGPRPRLLDYF